MSASTVQAIGRITAIPVTPTSPGSKTDTIDLAFVARSYASVLTNAGTVAGTTLAPFQMGKELAAIRLVHLNVLDGSSVTLLVGTASTPVQKVQVSGQFTVKCDSPADAITYLALVGTADVEYLLAGDPGANTAPPPPLQAAIPFEVAVATGTDIASPTDGSEKVIADFVVNFANLTTLGTLLMIELQGLALVDAPSNFTLAVRLGGTPGNTPTGTVVASYQFAGTTTRSVYAGTGQTTARPPGLQYVQITLQAANGRTATVHGITGSLRAA